MGVYPGISFSGQNLTISQCEHDMTSTEIRRPEHFHQGIQDFRRDTRDTRPYELFEVGADLQDPWHKTTNSGRTNPIRTIPSGKLT
jgi:hypothetical protein